MCTRAMLEVRPCGKCRSELTRIDGLGGFGVRWISLIRQARFGHRSVLFGLKPGPIVNAGHPLLGKCAEQKILSFPQLGGLVWWFGR